MYACAARFSPFQEVVDAEERFVDLAQRHIKLALRWHRAGKQTVQASSLLSLYFCESRIRRVQLASTEC